MLVLTPQTLMIISTYPLEFNLEGKRWCLSLFLFVTYGHHSMETMSVNKKVPQQTLFCSIVFLSVQPLSDEAIKINVKYIIYSTT